MATTINTYTDAHVVEVKQFNRRLRQGGIRFQFPEYPVPKWLPSGLHNRLYQEYFVVTDNEQKVRGAYILKHQDFQLDGEIVTLGDYQLPISEGTIDRAYNLLGVQMHADALRRRPLMYALGMGGVDQPMPKFLKAMRWTLRPVPFYFRVLHARRFLRRMTSLRTSLARRLAMDIAANSGIGWAGLKVLDALKRGPAPKGTLTAKTCDSFDSWADDIWREAHSQYLMAAIRSSDILDVLYPSSDERWMRLVCCRNDQIVGWVVLLATKMENHKQFGELFVGTIVDCLARPGHEDAVVALATDHLRKTDVDLIVSNQASRIWGKALTDAGYRSGPSNFILATSPQLTQRLGSDDAVVGSVHLNRGDGDGPINL
ncbi:MAG: hypothetical protein KKA42_14265 [candidate division Zixibacteria bacterium]|nr:hypothetical protein [candidate division Zixibacteria bacterium]